jgi:hypothetical protein
MKDDRDVWGYQSQVEIAEQISQRSHDFSEWMLRHSKGTLLVSLGVFASMLAIAHSSGRLDFIRAKALETCFGVVMVGAGSGMAYKYFTAEKEGDRD